MTDFRWTRKRERRREVGVIRTVASAHFGPVRTTATSAGLGSSSGNRASVDYVEIIDSSMYVGGMFILKIRSES
jgi:hypothetical protein